MNRLMNRSIVMALVLTGFVMFAIGRHQPDQVSTLVVLGIISVVLASFLIIRTRNLANAVDCRIDERERARRDHAHRIAYWSLCLPVGLFVGITTARLENALRAGTDLVIGHEHLVYGSVLLWLTFLFWCCLPSMILLWSEPEPLEPEEQV